MWLSICSQSDTCSAAVCELLGRAENPKDCMNIICKPGLSLEDEEDLSSLALTAGKT